MGTRHNCDTRSTTFFGIRREMAVWGVRISEAPDVSVVAANAREAGELALAWWNTPSLSVENCEDIEYSPRDEPFGEDDILSITFEGTIVR